MVKLWHCDTDRSHVLRDRSWFWCFWQKSQPYRIIGSGPHEISFSGLRVCEVYTLGADVLLFSGLLAEVPLSMRSYLHEVRVRI